MDYASIKGFNYQPSWGSTGYELWRYFDAERMSHELALGKLYFPRMNAIRLWLSYDAWTRDPARFERCFETALAIADKHALVVMPVLFNRWHDAILDYGGLYLDHILPKVDWWSDQTDAFTEAIAGSHARDRRVFAWDICNEPFSYYTAEDRAQYEIAERAWMTHKYEVLKRAGAQAPVTVGIGMGGLDLIRHVEPISDILSTHPYWGCGPCKAKDAFLRRLDEYTQFAQQAGKPLLATETCWGSTDDARRVEIIRFTLGHLKARGIGWLVYILHHSLIADAHRAEFGYVSETGNLAFIEADGTLRPGHEAFNEF